MNTLLDTLQDQPEARPMQHRSSPFHQADTAADYEAGYPSDNAEPQPRELTLGTATILALFFALAVICAVFFAFGYSLGSHRTVAATPAAVLTTPAAITTAKPAPGSLATLATHSDPAPPPEAVTVPIASASSHVAPAAAAVPPADTPDPRPVLALNAQPIVQVAAVSHQEDAELIASTLKRRGYAVTIRSEPQDKLLHLQLGPFPAKKDAEAMRQRLLADGFNAYIK